MTEYAKENQNRIVGRYFDVSAKLRRSWRLWSGRVFV
jgi:hypothetical protein